MISVEFVVVAEIYIVQKSQRLLLSEITSADVYTISIYNSQFLIFTIKASSVYIDRMYTELNSYNNDNNYK